MPCFTFEIPEQELKIGITTLPTKTGRVNLPGQDVIGSGPRAVADAKAGSSLSISPHYSNLRPALTRLPSVAHRLRTVYPGAMYPAASDSDRSRTPTNTGLHRSGRWRDPNTHTPLTLAARSGQF